MHRYLSSIFFVSWIDLSSLCNLHFFWFTCKNKNGTNSIRISENLARKKKQFNFSEYMHVKLWKNITQMYQVIQF